MSKNCYTYEASHSQPLAASCPCCSMLSPWLHHNSDTEITACSPTCSLFASIFTPWKFSLHIPRCLEVPRPRSSRSQERSRNDDRFPFFHVVRVLSSFFLDPTLENGTREVGTLKTVTAFQERRASNRVVTGSGKKESLCTT